MFEFRGVDNLYVAKVTKDDADGYTCEEPVRLSYVAEVGKNTATSTEAHYYDNKAMLAINSEGEDAVNLIIAPPELDMLSKITGRSFDETTGMMVESERNNDYYAIMYRTKGTDGKYRYVSRLKGTFAPPDESSKTEDNGTETTNSTVVFTGIYTEHEFTKGKKVGNSWVKASAKSVVIDERYDKVDFTNFFSQIQTPDTVTPKAQG